MTDDLIAKLRRMAERGTPHEAEVAREKLLVMAGRGGIPPRRPAAPAGAPAPDPGEGIGGWFAEGMRDWRMRNRGTTAAWASVSTNSSANVHVTFTGGRNT